MIIYIIIDNKNIFSKHYLNFLISRISREFSRNNFKNSRNLETQNSREITIASDDHVHEQYPCTLVSVVKGFSEMKSLKVCPPFL